VDRFDINKISKGNISIVEYCKEGSEEVEKVFVSCGIMGFYADSNEMRDLRLLLDYYLNIESIESISFS